MMFCGIPVDGPAPVQSFRESVAHILGPAVLLKLILMK
jgi:hypothetical protein